ncbi:MAG: prepilin-type N-terminal cleavage/methylation domain-containing protein [Candidatus Omnitrophota bacterium]
MPENKKIPGVTLIELIIAIVLISFIVLGIANIDTFFHFHVLNADRRIKIQYETSISLEHMTKEMVRAIGDTNKPPVTLLLPSGSIYRGIRVWVDENQNGIQDTYPTDREIGYLYQQGSSTIQYYNPCRGPSCNWAGSLLNETLSRQIAECTFTWSASTGNFVDVNITSRHNTSVASSVDNPEMNMIARIQMPAVSTH